MLLPEVFSLVAAYTFLVSRLDHYVIVKAVKSDNEWYSFVDLPYISNFAPLENEINRTLIFNDVLVYVDKTLFNKGLERALVTQDVYFEQFLVRKSKDLHLSCAEIPEFKRKSVLEEAFQIVQYSQTHPAYLLDSFDITKDDPKEWIRRVDFVIRFVNGDPKVLGKHVVGLLMYKSEWDW